MPTRPLPAEELERTLRVYAEHGRVQGAAAKALGISRSTLQHRLRLSGSSTDGKTMSTEPRSAKGRSLEEFQAAHDKSFIVPSRIKAALKELGNGWEYEMPFAKMAGVSLGDLSAFRSMFEDHIVLVDRTKRAWAGTTAAAAKMREMVS